MTDVSPQEMANKLMSDGFSRTGPVAETLTDPITDTAMVVTLDQLRPYELDPRLTRNPLYEEIKASIRQRGLDAPPPITRRPGADHYIIRNGGNTRLAILRDLWSVTKDERFFRIGCLFRPWPERGEIVALTGHLAENELHGGLSFIERALGVEKVRELYEQEDGKSLSQSELARRLKADGYPVPQPHISRMQEAIQFLLPAIPSVLYAGLGRPQVEQLTYLRRAGSRIWDARVTKNSLNIDFATLFQDVLMVFDSPGSFTAQRVQDELIGQMSELLGVDYDTLVFEITDSEKRWQLLTSEPNTPPGTETTGSVSTTKPTSPSVVAPPTSSSTPRVTEAPRIPASHTLSIQEGPATHPPADVNDDQYAKDDHSALLQEHIVSPAETTERLQSIQRLVTDHVGETPPDFETSVLQAIPVQAGGLHPISDVWYIDPGLDTPDRLRVHIAQFAREIANEAGLEEAIVACDEGIGFKCAGISTDENTHSNLRGALLLLHSLSVPYQPDRTPPLRMPGDLGALLLGLEHSPSSQPTARLSDTSLVKLFRLVRLARRLLDIEADITDGDATLNGS
ncbi:ParB family protein [Pseudomonas alkylphenolica]|uniref:Integrating conjugative element ParB n=1 Tax=Pseudomonas alkylphenolica TaxID=237609 RepID=A0A077F9W4_9PSED|nr:ParB family protein [Pseudomonas alkylphenolica]AIL62202.1 integrating conjugative element ParB [Pseudomonas alkylphenolica]